MPTTLSQALDTLAQALEWLYLAPMIPAALLVCLLALFLVALAALVSRINGED